MRVNRSDDALSRVTAPHGIDGVGLAVADDAPNPFRRSIELLCRPNLEILPSIARELLWSCSPATSRGRIAREPRPETESCEGC